MSVLDEAISVLKKAEAEMEIKENLINAGVISQGGFEKSLDESDNTQLASDVDNIRPKINEIIALINTEFGVSIGEI